MHVYEFRELLYLDQPGHFPFIPSKGNQYLMVVVEVYSNFIECEPMRNCLAGEMFKAYSAIWRRLTVSGIAHHKKHILDNEVSDEFKAAT